MAGNIYISIFTAFAVSYLIRVLPLTLIRKPIKNKFLKSFLFGVFGLFAFPLFITTFVIGVALINNKKYVMTTKYIMQKIKSIS